jgi:predicted DNA-binding protein (MmcQ/YjbR family)
MYTDQMKTAVHSLDGTGPKGFYLQIIDNDHFLTVKASEKQFMQLVDDEKRQAIEYMAKVKKALEMNGAIVLLVREGGEDV